MGFRGEAAAASGARSLFVRTVLALAAPTLREAAAAGDIDKANSPAMKVLQCEACHSVMSQLALDVKYLVESSKMWRGKDLRERVSVSCSDPTIASGAMKDACGYMLASYHKGIAAEVATRWDEDSEEFEEDIVPKEFCLKVGICKEKHKSLNEMISTSDRKQKDLKEQEEEKERHRAKRKKARYDLDEDADDEEEAESQWSQAQAAP